MRRHPSRGATLVEYALFASLVLVGLLAVLDSISTAAGDEVNNQAMCVSDRPPPTVDDDQCAFAPPPPDLVAPDPNVVPPTTVPPNPNPDVFALSSGTTSMNQNNGWTLVMPVSLTRTVWQDPPGEPVPEAGRTVVARVRFRDPSNPSEFLPGEQFVDCVTDAAGACTLEFAVPFPDVNVATMLVRNVDTPNPPDPMGSLATFERPAGW